QVGCYSILDFKGNIYLGTPSGIKVLSDKSLQEVKFENLDFDKPILKLRKVNDNEFLITTDGFGAYTSDLIQIRQLPETNYLSVQDAYVDETDIWLATDSGVYHYEQLEDGYNLVKIIDETNGLPTRNINAVTGVEENIIIGTDNGLAVFPKDLPTQSRLLDLYFENVAYNTTQVATNSESVRYSRANSLRADIGFIDYSDSENTFQYSYRLDPIHENWNATTSSTINFTDLKPDTYTLRIKSGELEEQMKFEISPLWWQRTPVRTALLILLLGSFLYIGYRFSRYFQEQQTKKLKQDKRLAEIRLNALRAQMNPHFVFNSLAAIQYYINNNEMEKSESFLVKFSKLIRRYFELSKEQEISIDDEVSLLQNYLEIEKLRFKDKLNFNIQVDQSLDSKNFMIPSMLLQPIVENAVNHGIFNKEETGKIDIGFKKVDHDKIQVVIEDDGVGYRNTLKKTKRKAKSSNVLSDRLYFLNQSGRWEITMSRKESNPESVNPGNICAFDIISKP
ncbi:MAG: histidine kinase, partial [Flavobacteriaceae bacterium]|nr:histidine kinase [Flavobacteriaceae bacterium]